MLYEVIPTRLFRADSGILTYQSDLKLRPGHLVRVPLGAHTATAVVIRSVRSVEFPTRAIIDLLCPDPLPEHLVSALFWLSDYYLTPLPTVAKLFLSAAPTAPPKNIPTAPSKATSAKAAPPQNRTKTEQNQISSLENSAKTEQKPNKTAIPAAPKIPLNRAQAAALSALHCLPGPTKLLFGVTGSGKTNLYLALARETLQSNRSVILLVPEISLTSQLAQIFQSYFPDQTLLLHSRLTLKERRALFLKLLAAKDPLILIGPRSALLAPLHNLGLIIIDEAHESAYFQDSSPKYSTVRLASFIASSLSKTKPTSCLLGSATPLITDYFLADRRHAVVSLTQKALPAARPPQIHLLDLKDSTLFSRNRYFSDPLLRAIEDNLTHHYQTLIFHNRRGSAPLTICANCGWQALCPACLLPLNLHADSFQLICHTCGRRISVPTSCPSCKQPTLLHKGFGTKLLESELNKLFKSAKIIRFDADNKPAETLAAKFAQIQSGNYDIIIGTQTIAKGLDLPRLATVGVPQADSGLSLPDFAAAERTFALLSQVIGRVGRGHLDAAEVFIQTYQPDHPAIVHAITENFSGFYQNLLETRRAGHLPPFYFLATLSVTYKTEATTLRYIRALHRRLLSQNQTKTEQNQISSLKNSIKTEQKPNKTAQTLLISPPTPAFHERTSSGFTWQIILRSTSRSRLISLLRSLPANPHFRFRLDPPSLL